MSSGPRSAGTRTTAGDVSACPALGLLDTPILVLNSQGLVVWANDSAQTKLGVARRGERWSEIQDRLPSDYIYRFHDDLPESLTSGCSGDDQRCVVVECTVKADSDAKEELNRLREANEELESIFNTLFDEVFVTDGYGVTIRVNKAVEPMYGLSKEDLLGRSVFDLERERVFYPSVTAMVLRERKRVTALQTTRSGRRLIVTGNPVFDANGDIVRVISYTRDITDPAASPAPPRPEQDEAGLPAPEFVASDPVMRDVLAVCRRVAPTQATVLLLGETGVGKNRLARLIHSLSTRSQGPFVEINCATIPESLFE
ncbi:MAG: sigma 54-interacting transcriptional regulator, partial [Alicyclobacillus sp.]|nr:sigma 54-interacting transcriptional regulator [Alicyclobacillus sp.]